MADDFDIEAMLEAPYNKKEEADVNGESKKPPKEKKRSRSRSKNREPKKSRERRRSRSKEKHRSSKSSKDHSRRSRSRDKHRSRDKDKRSRSKERKRRSPTPPPAPPPPPPMIKEKLPDMTPEERDARTVFCFQLAKHVRPRDLEEFFSSVGRVKDVRMITDPRSRKPKGIAYIEFRDIDSVPLAIGLQGQRLLGVPIQVQATQSEKNRLANPQMMSTILEKGPMRLYVGSLHFNITEDMLRGIFEPFGKIDHINLVKDPESGRSKGFGFVTFHNAEDARKALEQLNGFELAGRPMKLGHVTEKMNEGAVTSLDTDDLDRSGIDLGATGRLALMAKLAESSGMQMPQYALNALNMAQVGQTEMVGGGNAPAIATPCFVLSNMFNSGNESGKDWDKEIRDDVIDECSRFGGVHHVYVDRASPTGNVYVKCPSIASAVNVVNSLHGRYFSGQVVTANYVPVSNYHQLFPESISATVTLTR